MSIPEYTGIERPDGTLQRTECCKDRISLIRRCRQAGAMHGNFGPEHLFHHNDRRLPEEKSFSRQPTAIGDDILCSLYQRQHVEIAEGWGSDQPQFYAVGVDHLPRPGMNRENYRDVCMNVVQGLQDSG